MKRILVVFAAVVLGALVVVPATATAAGAFPQPNEPVVCDFQYEIGYTNPPPLDFHRFESSGGCTALLQLKRFFAKVYGAFTTDDRGCPVDMQLTMGLSDSAYEMTYYRLPANRDVFGSTAAPTGRGTNLRLLLDPAYIVRGLANPASGPSAASTFGLAVGTAQSTCTVQRTGTLRVSVIATFLAPRSAVYSIFDPPPVD